MMVLLAVAALVFFGWTVYGATRAAAAAYEENVSVTLRFDDRDLLDLVAEKRAALATIKTSELDFETGKVSQDDFDEVMASTSEDAIDVMRRLDAVRANFRFQKNIDRDLDELERELTRRSKQRPRRPADSGDLLLADGHAASLAQEQPDELSPAARARQQLHQSAAPKEPSLACESCGCSLSNDDKFCPECGHSAQRTCAACEAVLRAGSKFCHECGERTSPSTEGE